MKKGMSSSLPGLLDKARAEIKAVIASESTDAGNVGPDLRGTTNIKRLERALVFLEQAGK